MIKNYFIFTPNHRLLRVHTAVISHLKKNMPSVFGKVSLATIMVSTPPPFIDRFSKRHKPKWLTALLKFSSMWGGGGSSRRSVKKTILFVLIVYTISCFVFNAVLIFPPQVHREFGYPVGDFPPVETMQVGGKGGRDMLFIEISFFLPPPQAGLLDRDFTKFPRLDESVRWRTLGLTHVETFWGHILKWLVLFCFSSVFLDRCWWGLLGIMIILHLMLGRHVESCVHRVVRQMIGWIHFIIL